jgi:mRNA-degrading endonuclease RelE of RelBE toxin-antitoxin system
VSDKIRKFLSKLSAKDLAAVRQAMCAISTHQLEGLDVKSLKGKPGYIRVRVGRVRIICRLVKDQYVVLHIANRDEKTYKNL